MWLVWGIAQWASNKEKLLACQRNIPAPDNHKGLLSEGLTGLAEKTIEQTIETMKLALKTIEVRNVENE